MLLRVVDENGEVLFECGETEEKQEVSWDIETPQSGYAATLLAETLGWEDIDRATFTFWRAQTPGEHAPPLTAAAFDRAVLDHIREAVNAENPLLRFLRRERNADAGADAGAYWARVMREEGERRR